MYNQGISGGLSFRVAILITGSIHMTYGKVIYNKERHLKILNEILNE